MFIRRDPQILKSGETVTYLSLAHNARERDANGKSRPKPIVFVRLGREDERPSSAWPVKSASGLQGYGS